VEVALVESPFAIDSLNKGNYNYYLTSTELVARLEELAVEYPNLVRTSIIGHSVQGKPLYALSITDYASSEDSDKPALLFIAQQHAREPITCLSVLYWAEQLLGAFGRDSHITSLLSSTTIHLVPQANPDGNDIFLTSDASIRTNLRPSDLDGNGITDDDPLNNAGLSAVQKNLAYFSSEWLKDGEPFRFDWMDAALYRKFLGYFDYAGNAIAQIDDNGNGKINEDRFHGVDLNRNWSVGWVDADYDPASITYRGPSAFSEPETQALRDFILETPNIRIAADVHSGLELIFYPRATGKAPIRPETLAAKATEFLDVQSVPIQGGIGQAAPWLQSKNISALTLEIYQGTHVISQARLGSTNLFTAYTTPARLFNPPVADIIKVCSEWAPYYTYLLEETAKLSVKAN